MPQQEEMFAPADLATLEARARVNAGRHRRADCDSGEDGLFLAEDLFVATEAGWVSEADHYHRWPRPFKQTDHWLPEHELLSGLRDGA